MRPTDGSLPPATLLDSGTGRRPGQPLVSVSHLRISMKVGHASTIVPVRDVSFDIHPGERVGIVGESGSGKSLTALALLGLIHRVGGTVEPPSQVSYRGLDIVGRPESAIRPLRGREIGMIFQDPLTSLNPVRKIGSQMIEAISLHEPGLSEETMRSRAGDLLESVRLPRARQQLQAYPHELSGGMRQRVMIAMALAPNPSLLIADEPTTALDVTIQAGIFDLLHEISESRGLAVLLITHDLAVAAGFTDHMFVMYSGRIVEHARTVDFYGRPRHPYARALLGAIPPVDRRVPSLTSIPGSPPDAASPPPGCAFHPRCSHADERCAASVPPLELIESPGPDGSAAVACFRADEIPRAPRGTQAADEPGWLRVTGGSPTPGEPARVAISVRNLSKHYQIRRLAGGGRVHALDDVSLDVIRGEAFGIVGESGSGKTTLARCMLRLTEPSSGRIEVDGEDILTARRSRLRALRAGMQMVFQDPGSSLDPRFTVEDLVCEPMRIHESRARRRTWPGRARELMDLVQLPESSLEKYPHEFSGGQRQRIAIARALALKPQLVVCDEPVSALDVSVRSAILNLLASLRTDLGLTLIFVAHDLSLVRFLCDRVAVMSAGALVELQPTEQLFAHPGHPYTAGLLAAQPAADPVEERRRRAVRRGREAHRPD